MLLFILSVFIIIKAALTSENTFLEKEANIVMEKLTNNKEGISLLESNDLIEEKLKNLNEMDYGEVRNMLGVKNDFCIYLEDITGNVVEIDSVSTGIGSNKIYINGEPCE